MTARYLELLGERDLTVLASAAGLGPGDGAPTDDPGSVFRAEPDRIEPALASVQTFVRLFDASDRDETLVRVSPMLMFAVLVHRGAAEVAEASYVTERIGGRTLVPVFDGGQLAHFATDGSHRLFLVELLGSYTKVVSGPRWVKQGSRWRKRRFSEMDPVQLAGLLDGVADAERTGVYRRLGDLALFVTGVFPDHAATTTVAPIALERLLRTLPPRALAQLGGEWLERMVGNGTHATVLGGLGPLWYRLAARSAPLPTVAEPLAEAAESFDQARRFLTFVTDRYLFNRREWLFPFSLN